jgi:DNA polymerase III subunit chi
MTDINFHFNVPERSVYACRLLRKAVRNGAKVVVSAPSPQLAQFDRQLWVFEPLDFVPHTHIASGSVIDPVLSITPIWLVDDLLQAPHHDVLLNLGDEVPAGFEKFSRLIEIVSVDDSSRALARSRWKYYAQTNHAITRHDVATQD